MKLFRITTAGISIFQGLGLEISSDTLMRELSSLVSSGSYTQQASLINAGEQILNYQILPKEATGTSVTYGFLW